MSKLLVIGIDGLDFEYVSQHLDRLETFRKLSERGSLCPLQSVFPPDSIPAWISIFTGTQPSHHGIMDSVDYLEKNYRQFKVQTERFAHKTFWDAAGKMGRRVCVINPFMAYPVWPVNGCMISGPVFIDGLNQAYPADILRRYPDCPPLGGIVDFPTRRSLPEFVRKTHDDAERLAAFSAKVLAGESWDLGFVSFFTMDRLQHFLWRFSDPSDPTYPGKTGMESAVLDHYVLFDRIVNQLMQCLPPDGQVLVISDHGHGMRCTMTVNLNEYLRRKGYLKDDCGRFPVLSRKYWLERLKNCVMSALYAVGQENLLYVLGRFIPDKKRLKSAEHVISKKGSTAWVPKFAGCGPYGGIQISPDVPQERYNSLREAIITDLTTLNGAYNDRLFKWVKPNDEFQGTGKAYRYPDIVFELFPEYGVNWSLFVPLISTNFAHRRLSGGHKWYGVIGTSWPQSPPVHHVVDIHNVIIGLLESIP